MSWASEEVSLELQTCPVSNLINQFKTCKWREPINKCEVLAGINY